MMATSNALPYNCLALGSTNRLMEFERRLCTDNLNVVFDDRILRVLEKYAYDKADLQRVRNYLRNLTDPDGMQFCRSMKQFGMVYEQIVEFSKPDFTSFRWNRNYQEALKEVKRIFELTLLRPLIYSCDQDIIDALPRKDTHSGWTFIETGLKEKGDNLEDIFSRYCDVRKTAFDNGSFCKPILPGIRTQASGEFKDDWSFSNTCKHKTRLVSMVDLFQIIGELVFAKPFQYLIGQFDFYAGGKNPNDIARIISNYRSKHQQYVSLDYSRYDQTISSWLIEDAFDIIKVCFKGLTHDEERLFDIVKHDFIHKDFVSGKNGLIHADKGVPSGSMFTQIIDSVVNLVMIKTYLKSRDIKGDMIIMGDDNLLYYSGSPLTPQQFADDCANYISHNFGIKVNGDKSSKGTRFEDPEFLSRVWKNGGQWRHPRELISRMLYPERFRNYNAGQFSAELIVYSYIQAYKLGMMELMNVEQFLIDFGFKPADLLNVDRKSLPGYLRWQGYTLNDIRRMAV